MKLQKIIYLAILSLFFNLLSCSKLDDPTSISTDNIITIKTEKDSILANGADKTLITAELKGDTPDGQTLTFKTDKGYFSGIPGSGTGNIQQFTLKSSARTASVYLVSSTEETDATVSVSVSDFLVFTTVEFKRISPSRIIISSNRFELPADGNSAAQLTVSLISPMDIGTVTEGTRILFTVENASTNVELTNLHMEALSDQNGVAKTSFVGTDKGQMRIIARVDKLDAIRDTILITCD